MPLYASINLHPTSHPISSLKSTTYDVIALGSGWAGRVLAARVCAAGLSSLIIENELVGGDCPYWACVPSKALLRPGEVLEDAAAVGGVKERLSQANLDIPAVFATRDAFTHRWNDGELLVPLVERSGAALVRGTGRIVGDRTVEVEGAGGEKATLTARVAVAVCTGSNPKFPDVPGLVESKPWTPREATSSSVMPASLVVLGAGAVGTEMATAYASFGSKVTVVCPQGEILPMFDAEAGKLVREGLEEHGVEVLLDVRATGVQRRADGTVRVELSGGKAVEADELLVAAGRKAKTAGIGLEAYGLPVNGSPLPVDESLCVSSVPGGWLYAGGDVNGRAPLTHSSKYHGRVIANAIIAKAKGKPVPSGPWTSAAATADSLAIPQVVFTNPTLASVGLTKKAAAAAGKMVRVVTASMASVGSAILQGNHAKGWAQWIVEEPTGRLLGATMVGKDIGDLLHASTVAVVGELTLDRLAHAIPPFPTASEVYLNLLEAAGI